MNVPPEENQNQTQDSVHGAQTPPSTESSDWVGHEHVSEQVQLEAEKLVNLVGSADLAKHAISVVEQRQLDGTVGTAGERLASNSKESEHPLIQTLKEFETTLATPIVSGELIEWSTNAAAVCGRLGKILRDDIPRQHGEVFARILQQDLTLASQIEKLKSSDTQLVDEQLDLVESSLQALTQSARSAKQDEAKLATASKEAVKLAMEFVVAVRAQETIIETWLIEAFSRDLGSGD